MRWLPVAILLMATLEMLSPSLSIRVSPVVLFEGHAVRVTCHVPLSSDNRALVVALDGYRESELPIGENGPVTTEILYDHVPCDVESASCTVVRATGAIRRVWTHLQVVCRG